MTQSVTELGLPTPKERRRLREAADLTHEEVAAAVGVTSNTVRSWETGRTHPRGRKLEAYSKLLNRLSADTSPGPSGPTARTEGSGSQDGPDRKPSATARPDRAAGSPAAATGTGTPARDGAGGAGAGSGTGTPARDGAGASSATGTPAPDGAGARSGTGTPARDRTESAGVGSTAGTLARDRGEGTGARSTTGTPTHDRADNAGASAAGTGTPARQTRPAWANGTAVAQSGASAVGSSATTGPAGADADGASAPGGAPGSRLGSAAEGAANDPGAATDAAPEDADAASAAEAPEGRFGLRMMRGLTRPVGAQTRPKAAVKRAAKPPVGVPRHEAKSPVKAGAATGGGGGGRAILRPGGPLPSSTGTGAGTGAGAGAGSGTGTGSGTGKAPDTTSGTGPDSEPRSGKATAPGTTPGTGSPSAPGTAPSTGSPSGAGSAAAARTGTARPGSGADAADGTGPDRAAVAAKAGRKASRKAAGDTPGPGSPGAGEDARAGARTAPAGDGTADGAPTATPVSAFDALYDRTAPALARQAYLLTGRRALACEAVERAFQQAWERWPEVATDPDPVGWVRAATYEYALSPWHRFRRSHRHPDKPPADPADRILLDAMLDLPPAHRRTVLLYDGVGLDLPDTAAETEASTPTAGSRLLNAHDDLADRLPELDGVAPAKQSAVLRERLGALRPPGRLEPRAAAAVRVAGEHRTRLWTRAVVGVTAVITAATAYTWVTAPTEYEPPRAPGTSVSGVPPHSGPQQLTDEGRQLHDKLLSDPSAGPSRIGPSLE